MSHFNQNFQNTLVHWEANTINSMNKLQPFPLSLCNRIFLKMAVVLIFSCFSFIAQAQPCDTTFIKRIGNRNASETAFKIIEVPDGNFLIGGKKEDASLLLLIQPDGEVVWEKRFDILTGSEFIGNMIIDSEGKLVAVGRGVNSFMTANYMFRFDLDTHTMLWTRIQRSPTYNIYDGILELPNQNYLINGVYASSSVEKDHLLMEMQRSDGAKLSEKRFHSGQRDAFNDTISKNGFIYTANASYNRSAISKFDLTGNQIWTKLQLRNTTESAQMNAVALKDLNDTLVVLSVGDLNSASFSNHTVQLHTTNVDGEIIWAKNYEFPGKANTASDLLPVSDGYLIQSYRAASKTTQEQTLSS